MQGTSDDISFRHLFFPLTTRKYIFFLLIITLCLFFFSLFNSFVGDDNTQIIDNPAVHSIANIPLFFLENRLHSENTTLLGSLYYKPLLDSFFTIVYALFGTSPFFYHAAQLILFFANAVLVFLFFKTWFRQIVAGLLAVLFLIHPINSEVALYIADTQDVLFFFFGMIALLIIMKYNSLKLYVLASFCLLLSILSKETGALFFIVCLGYTWMYKRKLFTWTCILYGVVSACYCILRIHAVGIFTHEIVNAPIQRLSFMQRLINIPEIVFFYLKTMIFPYTIASSWQWTYTQISFTHFFLPLFFDLCFFLLLVLAFLLIRTKPSQPSDKLYIFFAVWFCIGILFHIQFLPLDQTVADRWFYFPIVGLLGIIGCIVERFLQYKKHNRAILSVIVILIALLAFRTFIRTFDFKDDLTAASHDAAVTKDSYNAEFILSRIYYDRNQLGAAQFHAEKSVRLFPYISNYTNLGAIESRMGKYQQAKEAYLHALQYGDDALPYENLASLSFVYGSSGENIHFIKDRALKKYPQDGKLWFTLAVLEYINGQKFEAQGALQMARRYLDSPADPSVQFVQDVVKQNKQLSLKVVNGQVVFLSQQ